MANRGLATVRSAATKALTVLVACVLTDLAAAAVLRRWLAQRTFAVPSRYILDRPYARPDWARTDRPHDDRYVVALLGGSVSNDLAVSGATLAPWAEALAPRLRGRRLEVLNLAMPGGLQPIQLNMLGMAHHRIDAAVVLDGFNELFSDSVDCQGAAVFWRARGAAPAGELMGPVLADFRARLETSPPLWHWSAFAHFWRPRSPSAGLGGGDFFLAMQAPGGMRPPALRSHRTASPEEHAARWGHCVRATHAMAPPWDVKVLFFLQPNQHAGGKQFSAEERACCLAADGWSSSYRPVSARYDALEDEIGRLRAEGVHVWSLRSVFAGVSETVWRDSCCHVNARGNERLAAAIGARLAEVVP